MPVSPQAHPPAKATNWPVVNRLEPSRKATAKLASSSNPPRRPIGTWATTGLGLPRPLPGSRPGTLGNP